MFYFVISVVCFFSFFFPRTNASRATAASSRASDMIMMIFLNISSPQKLFQKTSLPRSLRNHAFNPVVPGYMDRCKAIN